MRTTSEKNTPTTSVFATKHTSAEDLSKLLTVGLAEFAKNGGEWCAAVEAATGIGYSRGWLIVRRAYLETTAPELLVDAAKLIADGAAKAEAAHTLSDYAPERTVLGPIVAGMRKTGLSWGEVMVRLGLTEGIVRRAFSTQAGMKDLGHRVAKGGRFAYDARELYQANRKAEGAWIALDAKGMPAVEALLNYVPEEAPKAKRAPRARKAS